MTNGCEPNDEALVRLAQQGNLEAFNNLYQHYLPAVYNRVRYVVPEQDVEDVVQEVFISVVKSLDSFKGNAQFSTWLRTLTNRRVADYYRKQKPLEAELDVDLSEANPGQVPGLRVAARTAAVDDAMMLRQALRALPDNYREVLLLRFAEGLPFKEIAHQRGQSLEATKSLFRRAIAALRKQVEEEND